MKVKFLLGGSLWFLKAGCLGQKKKDLLKTWRGKKCEKCGNGHPLNPHFSHTHTHTHGAILGVFVSPRRDRVIFGVIVICSRLQSERRKHRNRLISWRKRRTERERAGGKERG